MTFQRIANAPAELPVTTQDRTMGHREFGRRLGSTLRVDDGRATGPFCGGMMGNWKGRFHREIGEFGEKPLGRRTVCNLT
jgi:hypothetical protein